MPPSRTPRLALGPIGSCVAETLIAVARVSRKRVNEVIVMVLDRPRHAGLIAELRQAGAALRMISDGDIAAAMAPPLPDGGVDLYIWASAARPRRCWRRPGSNVWAGICRR